MSKLPHEHDESTEPAAAPDPLAIQGYADIARGLIDTDGREAAGRAFDRAGTRGSRKR